MDFIDMFAGIGGFRRGLELAGHNCLYSCEIDNNARKSYAAIHNVDGEPFEKDITKIDIEQIPQYEMICGGFPCQPFSRSGRRDAFMDIEKGNLFFNVMDVVRETNPRIVFLENVKGLLTVGEKDTIENEDGTTRTIEVNKGSTFRTILEAFNNLGYDVEWQLINSADYIAHKRERVYIIAHRRGIETENFRRIFPIRSDVRELNILRASEELHYRYEDFENNIQVNTKKQFRVVTDGMYEVSENNGFLQNDKERGLYQFNTTSPWGHWGIMINGICTTCKVKYKDVNNFSLRDMLESNDKIDEKNILSDEEIEKQRYAKSAKTWLKSGNKMGNMAFPDNLDKPSRTLTANSSGREMMVIGFEKNGVQKYRKLTSLEYWKLQGFTEEDYNRAVEAGVPETQLKKQAGNAVTVNVIMEIGKRLG